MHNYHLLSVEVDKVGLVKFKERIIACIIDVPLSLTHCSDRDRQSVLMKTPGHSLSMSTCNLPGRCRYVKGQNKV